MEENPYKAPMADWQKPTTASTKVKRPWCLAIGMCLGASLGLATASAITYHPSVQPLQKYLDILIGGFIGGVTLGAIGLAIDIARWHWKSRAQSNHITAPSKGTHL
jgi:hypothetical protein